MKHNMRILFKIISIILLMSVIAAFACYMVFLYPTSTFRARMIVAKFSPLKDIVDERVGLVKSDAPFMEDVRNLNPVFWAFSGYDSQDRYISVYINQGNCRIYYIEYGKPTYFMFSD